MMMRCAETPVLSVTDHETVMGRDTTSVPSVAGDVMTTAGGLATAHETVCDHSP